MPRPLRPGNILRFFFSAEDQARIDPTSIHVEDIPYSAAPTAAAPYPQAMRLTFKVDDRTKGAPQIRPLFPGSLTFVPDPLAAGVTPTPESITFTDEAYNSWKTTGMAMVKIEDIRVQQRIDALAPALEVKPNVVWYSPVKLPQEFLFTTLRSGLRPVAIKKKPKDEPWDKHAVARFLNGQYSAELRPGESPEDDDVQAHMMPTVVMDENTGMVTLVITTASVRRPLDGWEDELDDLISFPSIKPEHLRHYPAHPRHGAIPARHVLRALRLGMIDAAAGSPIADAVLADWPKAPRYFPLRFTRIFQPKAEFSIF